MLHAFQAVWHSPTCLPKIRLVTRTKWWCCWLAGSHAGPWKRIGTNRTRAQVTSKERHRSKTRNARAHSHRTWFPHRALRACYKTNDRTSGGMPNQRSPLTYIVNFVLDSPRSLCPILLLLSPNLHVTSTSRINGNISPPPASSWPPMNLN